MKASIDLNTGFLIESQSNSSDATMFANAAAAGFNNVEIRTIAEVELAALISARVPFQQQVASAIAKTYADVDALYAAAVGNRAEEYRQAETAALAYQAAGYSGAVSEYISSWATTNPPMTNAQAADVIIARAAALRSAMLSVRSQRFTSQSAMRAATTRAELDTAVAAWNAFVSQTRSALA